MSKPHKHSALIKLWADGAQMQFMDPDVGPDWYDCIRNPEWDSDIEYRVKPEKEYPTSCLTDEELEQIALAEANSLASWRAIANAAVKQYIQENEE